MKLTSQKKNVIPAVNSAKGFTLIEVLVVMAIIAGLAGIGYGVYFKVNRSAKENETEVMIKAVAAAMEARSTDISSAQRDELEIPDKATFPEGKGIDTELADTSTEDLVFYISGDFDGSGIIGDVDSESGVKSKLSEVVRESVGKGSFIKEVDGKWLIVDSWGEAIKYTHKTFDEDDEKVYRGKHHNSDDGFDLRSAGADRKFGTPDDIILE